MAPACSIQDTPSNAWPIEVGLKRAALLSSACRCLSKLLPWALLLLQAQRPLLSTSGVVSWPTLDRGPCMQPEESSVSSEQRQRVHG